MIAFPLTKVNRIVLARAFASVPRVDISVDCVLDDQMGSAYVAQPDDPTVFLIEQSGFFCYLAGDTRSAAGEEMVRELPAGRLLMSWNAGWQEAIERMHRDRLVPIKRYQFSSDKLSLKHVSGLLHSSPVRDQIRRLDAHMVRRTSEPILSVSDFESPDDFVRRGIGFGCVDDGRLVGAAYSSLVSSRGIEISLFVDEGHRRKGIATAVSSALLQWCLERGIEPHWDAANEESCKLAEKLGYVPTGTYQAYYLK